MGKQGKLPCITGISRHNDESIEVATNIAKESHLQLNILNNLHLRKQWDPREQAKFEIHLNDLAFQKTDINIEIEDRCRVIVIWTKAHVGISLNEAADRLAVTAAKREKFIN